MTIIALPPSFRVRNIDWDIDSPSQVNRSRWTGAEQVLAEPWHTRMSATFELVTIYSEPNVIAARGFLGSLKGRANTFRLPATEGPQYPGFSSPLVFGGAAQGATSLNVTNMPLNQNLAYGQLLTVNDQLVMLSANGTQTGSTSFIFPLSSPLRKAASNGTPIEARSPTALVALAASNRGWSVAAGQMYSIKMSAEERF